MEELHLAHSADSWISVPVFLALAFIIFFIGKKVYQLTHPNIDVKAELVTHDNPAFATTMVGYFIGLILAIGSAIIGPSNGLWIDVVDISVYGMLSIALLTISGFVNDKLILNKFSVEKEIISDRNVGTGVIEGANYVASGLIIFGAVSGESGGLLFGILTAITYWVIGQLIMILTAKFYAAFVKYDVHDEIEKDNVAAGFAMAGALIGVANLIRFGLMGDFESWQDTFLEVGLETVLGLALLPVIRFLTDKVLLPGENLTKEIAYQEKHNVGAGLIEAFAYIGGSVLLTWCL